MEKYADVFGGHTDLKLNEKTVEEVIDILNKILVGNPNTWIRKDLLSLQSEIPYNITALCINGLITVKKYEFKEPEEPTEAEEKDYNALVRISKARSENVFWLYWRAFNFFKSKGFYPYQIMATSPYMSLSTTNNLNKGYHHSWLAEEDLKSNIDKEKNELILESCFTQIRCGEIEGYRAISDLNSGGCLWIFPFIDEDDYVEDSAVCYLLQSDEKLRELQDKNRLEIFRKTQKRV